MARTPAPGPRAQPRVHPDVRPGAGGAFARVYEIVRRIPRGRVMTYGQVSSMLGGTLSPRAIGWAMHGAPKGVPWQRVVNASGGCSTEKLPDMPLGIQRALLEAEGVEFRANGTLELERYRWEPRTGRPRARGRAEGSDRRRGQ